MALLMTTDASVGAATVAGNGLVGVAEGADVAAGAGVGMVVGERVAVGRAAVGGMGRVGCAVSVALTGWVARRAISVGLGVLAPLHAAVNSTNTKLTSRRAPEE